MTTQKLSTEIESLQTLCLLSHLEKKKKTNSLYRHCLLNLQKCKKVSFSAFNDKTKYKPQTFWVAVQSANHLSSWKFFTCYFLKITCYVAQGWLLGFRRKLLSTSIDSPHKPREVHGLSEGKELAQRRAAPVLLCAMEESHPHTGQGQFVLCCPCWATDLCTEVPCTQGGGAKGSRGSKCGHSAAAVLQGACSDLQSEPENSPCSAIPRSIIPRGKQQMYLGTFVLQVLFPVLFLTKEKPNLKRKKKEQFVSVTLVTQASTLKHRF